MTPALVLAAELLMIGALVLAFGLLALLVVAVVLDVIGLALLSLAGYAMRAYPGSPRRRS